MAESKRENGYSYVDWAGRRYVDTDALLKDPKVQETFKRMSKANEKYRNQPGVTFSAAHQIQQLDGGFNAV